MHATIRILLNSTAEQHAREQGPAGSDLSRAGHYPPRPCPVNPPTRGASEVKPTTVMASFPTVPTHEPEFAPVAPVATPVIPAAIATPAGGAAAASVGQQLFVEGVGQAEEAKKRPGGLNAVAGAGAAGVVAGAVISGPIAAVALGGKFVLG